MDDQRFDSLTRGLARGRSRRDLFKLLAGGTAATVLAATVANDAAAECHGITCMSDGECCAGAPICSGGVCVVSAPAPAPAPATTTDTSTAAVMPAAGAGPAASDMTPWLGVALAGGAAAWVAGPGAAQRRAAGRGVADPRMFVAIAAPKRAQVVRSVRSLNPLSGESGDIAGSRGAPQVALLSHVLGFQCVRGRWGADSDFACIRALGCGW